MLYKEYVLKKVIAKVDKEKFDSKSIEIGKDIEKEHAPTIKKLLLKFDIHISAEEFADLLDEVSENISRDHLHEFSNYYIAKDGKNRLKELEKIMKDEL